MPKHGTLVYYFMTNSCVTFERSHGENYFSFIYFLNKSMLSVSLANAVFRVLMMVHCFAAQLEHEQHFVVLALYYFVLKEFWLAPHRVLT